MNQLIEIQLSDNMSPGGVCSKDIADIISSLEELTQRHNCEARIRAKDGETLLQAIITPQTEIADKYHLNGETILYGEIKRVGGDEPTIYFKPVHGKPISCKTTKDLAKKAGNYLYTQVGLSGIAKLDTETFEIKSFRALAITDYKKKNIKDAFRELSETIGDWADSITDVNLYTDNIRYGEAEES